MPRKSRPFISRKEGETFVLMHRSQQDPKYYDDDASKLVLMSTRARLPQPNYMLAAMHEMGELDDGDGFGEGDDAGTRITGRTSASARSKKGHTRAPRTLADRGITDAMYDAASVVAGTRKRAGASLPAAPAAGPRISTFVARSSDAGSVRSGRGLGSRVVREISEVDGDGMLSDGYGYGAHLKELGGGVGGGGDRDGAASHVSGGSRASSYHSMAAGVRLTHDIAARLAMPASVLPSLPEEEISRDEMLEAITLHPDSMPADLREAMEAVDEGDELEGDDEEGDGDGGDAGSERGLGDGEDELDMDAFDGEDDVDGADVTVQTFHIRAPPAAAGVGAGAGAGAGAAAGVGSSRGGVIAGLRMGAAPVGASGRADDTMTQSTARRAYLRRVYLDGDKVVAETETTMVELGTGASVAGGKSIRGARSVARSVRTAGMGGGVGTGAGAGDAASVLTSGSKLRPVVVVATDELDDDFVLQATGEIPIHGSKAERRLKRRGRTGEDGGDADDAADGEDADEDADEEEEESEEEEDGGGGDDGGGFDFDAHIARLMAKAEGKWTDTANDFDSDEEEDDGEDGADDGAAGRAGVSKAAAAPSGDGNLGADLLAAMLRQYDDSLIGELDPSDPRLTTGIDSRSGGGVGGGLQPFLFGGSGGGILGPDAAADEDDDEEDEDGHAELDDDGSDAGSGGAAGRRREVAVGGGTALTRLMDEYLQQRVEADDDEIVMLGGWRSKHKVAAEQLRQERRRVYLLRKAQEKADAAAAAASRSLGGVGGVGSSAKSEGEGEDDDDDDEGEDDEGDNDEGDEGDDDDGDEGSDGSDEAPPPPKSATAAFAVRLPGAKAPAQAPTPAPAPSASFAVRLPGAKAPAAPAISGATAAFAVRLPGAPAPAASPAPATTPSTAAPPRDVPFGFADGDFDEASEEAALEATLPTVKEKRWDAATIISTYTNTENRPKPLADRVSITSARTGFAARVLGSERGRGGEGDGSVTEPGSEGGGAVFVGYGGPLIRLSRKTGLPLGTAISGRVAKARAAAREALATVSEAAVETAPTAPASTPSDGAAVAAADESDSGSDDEGDEAGAGAALMVRRPDETPEERRARKAAVKAARREGRATKKAVRVAFKAEGLRQERMAHARDFLARGSQL